MVVIAKAYPSVEFTLPLLADVAFDSRSHTKSLYPFIQLSQARSLSTYIATAHAPAALPRR